MSEQYVGIDLHRRRSVIVRTSVEGEVLAETRIDNDPVSLALEIAKAGPDPEVVLEATYGWYWAVDVLELQGASVHLAHPLGINGFKNQRVKKDGTDALHLADLLRMNRLPESWIAPPATRELRELVRYRAKLVALRSGLKVQIHAVLAKEGVRVPMSDLFGLGGTRLLDEVQLARAYDLRVRSLRKIITLVDKEITGLEAETQRVLKEHQGYRAIQDIPGVGKVLAAIFVAEVGDVSRFSKPQKLCSWAGLTPRHHESDTTVRRGHITKQGSRLVRWAAIEATTRITPARSKIAGDLRRIAARRGTNIARVAAGRKVLTLVYYGLRDGEIRCLHQYPEAA
ncbi:MAG TPA: IS110 family transposase [Actinomycetota bacterium]|jgi:transposase|nr:IS110 family transposase [Actinomycetota bacterium]